MAAIQRSADASWQGDLRGGKGEISTPSGVLNHDAFSFVTRFENAPGTNPEELIVAAHAACFSMNFSGVLSRNGYQPESIRTHGTLSLDKTDAGFSITKILLETEVKVANIDEAAFKQLADEAERTCPVSRLLRPGLQEVELKATLLK